MIEFTLISGTIIAVLMCGIMAGTDVITYECGSMKDRRKLPVKLWHMMLAIAISYIPFIGILALCSMLILWAMAFKQGNETKVMDVTERNIISKLVRRMYQLCE